MEIKKQFYIKAKNLPPKLPITKTLFWWMFLDYTHAPGWTFGFIGSMLFLLWFANIYDLVTKNGKDIFKNE